MWVYKQSQLSQHMWPELVWVLLVLLEMFISWGFMLHCDLALLQQMWNQEKDHLKKFNELMVAYRVRPTVLLPFWNVAGFVLGAGSALLGRKGAMACTVAVEESISEHYNNQIRTLIEEDPEKYKELLQVIKQFRDDEQEHHDIGLEHDAEATPAYSVLKTAIQLGCKAAIFLSERI